MFDKTKLHLTIFIYLEIIWGFNRYWNWLDIRNGRLVASRKKKTQQHTKYDEFKVRLGSL